MAIRFFDDGGSMRLQPLNGLISAADVRFGALTIRQKWEQMTSDFRAEVQINSRLLPDIKVIDAIRNLESGEALKCGEILLAFAGASHDVDYQGMPFMVDHVNDFFLKLDAAIRLDESILGPSLKSGTPKGARVIGNEAMVYYAEGATAEGASLNTTGGPILLLHGSTVMEGALVRGPFALGEHAQVKMGAKIYGPSAIGAFCKAGGELSNVLLGDFTNKSHDGFLGNSAIGRWCNLGADTNCSNLKNNYSPVSQWSYPEAKQMPTGLQFCGLVMGDHAKCGINTMFNTGTVVGTGANVFGTGFPPKFVPDFTWCGPNGTVTYDPEKFHDTMHKVMARRGLEPTKAEIDAIRMRFAMTAVHRSQTE